MLVIYTEFGVTKMGAYWEYAPIFVTYMHNKKLSIIDKLFFATCVTCLKRKNKMLIKCKYS